MGKGKIFILSGPSGSGKTTLLKKLLEKKRLTNQLVKSISATTRPKRENEINGRDYFFLTKRQFITKVNKGQFLEWQKVFENYYGTPISHIQTLRRKGINVVLCIDVKGAAIVRQKEIASISIFIKVPNLRVLKQRLLIRGTESLLSIKMRLKTARTEMMEASKYDYIIVNEELKVALKMLENIVLSNL